MNKRIYIETTVVSYQVARESQSSIVAGHQESTHRFWQLFGSEYEVYISDLVLQEAEQGNPEQARLRMKALSPFPVLDVDDEAKALAKLIILGRAVPASCPEDALHIAIAAVNGLDLIVTWNFSHINNPFTRMQIRQVVENSGYECPEICSPDELLGDDT